MNFKRRTLAAKTCEKISSFHRLLITTVSEPPQHLLQCKGQAILPPEETSFFKLWAGQKNITCIIMHACAWLSCFSLAKLSNVVSNCEKDPNTLKWCNMLIRTCCCTHKLLQGVSLLSPMAGNESQGISSNYRLGTWICRPLKVDENKPWNPLYLCTNNGVWAALQWPTPPPLLFANPWLPPHRMKGSERCPKAFCLHMAEAVCRMNMATSRTLLNYDWMCPEIHQLRRKAADRGEHETFMEHVAKHILLPPRVYLLRVPKESRAAPFFRWKFCLQH